MTFKVGDKRPPGSGRARGTANKSTQDARAAMALLLSGNLTKLQGWLDATAKHDPAKAFDLMLRLAEFTIPKLQRSEHVGEDGGPIKTVIAWPLQKTPLDQCDVRAELPTLERGAPIASRSAEIESAISGHRETF
jgi:hypothetical protein